MANKSDGDPKDSTLGNREHFDSFDRLQKVDQKNLNIDKLKATDKDSDTEELLVTKDKTHYDTTKEETGSVKVTTINFELDNHKIEHADLETSEESIKSDDFQLGKSAITSSKLLDTSLDGNNITQIADQSVNIKIAETKIFTSAKVQDEFHLPQPPISSANVNIQEKSSVSSEDVTKDSPGKTSHGITTYTTTSHTTSSHDTTSHDTANHDTINQDITDINDHNIPIPQEIINTTDNTVKPPVIQEPTNTTDNTIKPPVIQEPTNPIDDHPGGNNTGGGDTGGGNTGGGDTGGGDTGGGDTGGGNTGGGDTGGGDTGGGDTGGGDTGGGDTGGGDTGGGDTGGGDTGGGDTGGGDTGGGDTGGGNTDYPPSELPNGNYSLIPGHGFSITLDSINSETSYINSFGHYFADSNGNPISGSIDFMNVRSSLGAGDATTISYGADNIPAGAVTVGFFIIPNGYELNPGLPESLDVTFWINAATNHWAAYYNGNPINGSNAPAYFSDPNLNPDGTLSHSSNNAGQISFEDLSTNSTDGNYNNVVVNVHLDSYNDDTSAMDVTSLDQNNWVSNISEDSPTNTTNSFNWVDQLDSNTIDSVTPPADNKANDQPSQDNSIDDSNNANNTSVTDHHN